VWPEIRGQIVVGFLDPLETRLKRQLKGWQFDATSGVRFFETNYMGYHFGKPAWSDDYGIALQADDYGRRMVIGVWRNKPRVGKRRFSDELLEAMKAIYQTAKPDVLWRMNKERKFLDDVAGQLPQLAKISEPIIDGLVRKHKK
jgi:hypothetical protein